MTACQGSCRWRVRKRDLVANGFWASPRLPQFAGQAADDIDEETGPLKPVDCNWQTIVRQ